MNGAMNALVRRVLGPRSDAADVLMTTTPAPLPVPAELAAVTPLAAAYSRRIVGSTDQIELALEGLARIGIEGKTLALAAIEAVGVIDRLGGRPEVEIHRHMRHVRQENTASGARR